jgi:hypothetical protein
MIPSRSSGPTNACGLERIRSRSDASSLFESSLPIAVMVSGDIARASATARAVVESPCVMPSLKRRTAAVSCSF